MDGVGGAGGSIKELWNLDYCIERKNNQINNLFLQDKEKTLDTCLLGRMII